uniref:Uncharacterized protein n=1 Tax=Trichuris muris TaxID=70415 RepID=A0A5S6R367_TRIMR
MCYPRSRRSRCLQRCALIRKSMRRCHVDYPGKLFLCLLFCFLHNFGSLTAFVHDNPECGEPFHCPDDCVITWYGKCPSNCYCKPIRRCEPVKCPYPPPRCIIVTGQDGCQRCACEDELDTINKPITKAPKDLSLPEEINEVKLEEYKRPTTSRPTTTATYATETTTVTTEGTVATWATYPPTTTTIATPPPTTTTTTTTTAPTTETITRAPSTPLPTRIWYTTVSTSPTMILTPAPLQTMRTRIIPTIAHATSTTSPWAHRPAATRPVPISQLPAELRANETMRRTLEEYAKKICSLDNKRVIDQNFKALFSEIGTRLLRSNVYPAIFSFDETYLKRKCFQLKEANRRTPIEVRRNCFRKYYVFDELISLLSYPCSWATKDDFFRHFQCIQSVARQANFARCLPADISSIVRTKVRLICRTFNDAMPCMHSALTSSCDARAWEIFKQYLIIRILKLDPQCTVRRRL